MKLSKKVVLFCSCVILAGCASQVPPRPEVTYKYDDTLRWDKAKLDSPPQPIGGEAQIVEHLFYPRELRRQRIQGTAMVSVSTDDGGKIVNVSFAPRLNPGLEAIVVNAVRAVQWKPGIKKNHTASGTVSFPITFSLSAR